MSRVVSRSRRREKNKALGWALGTVGACILISITGVYSYQNLAKRDVDPSTGCPKDHYDTITAVLVDLTDPISPVQAAALKNTLIKVRDAIPKFGRLEIYPLEPTTRSAIEPIFSGCSPGSGRDVVSGWSGNSELADRRWKIMFADRVDHVIEELQNIPPREGSPILEGLQSVAVTALGAPLALSAPDKRILIVSDMIHHTPEFSMYQGAPSFDQFKNGQYYRRVRASLREAKVEVSLIVRETRRDVQQPPLYRFWLEMTTASNGYLQHWEPLQ